VHIVQLSTAVAEVDNELLFRWTPWMYLPYLKFVPLPVPEIRRGTQTIWAVPRYTQAPFSPKFFMGFCLDGPCECTCQIWSLFVWSWEARSWDNRRYSKNLGSPRIRPGSLFSQSFHGHLFGWTLWMYLPNLKFVALPVSAIIEGTQKNLSSPWICPGSLFSQFFQWRF